MYTDTPATIANIVANTIDIEAATGTTPALPAKPALRKWPMCEDLSEPEGYMLEAFRKWTYAQVDPIFRARLCGFELLQMAVRDVLDGRFTEEDAKGWVHDDADAPVFFASVKGVADAFHLFTSEPFMWDEEAEGEEETTEQKTGVSGTVEVVL